LKLGQYAKQLADLQAEIHSKPVSGLASVKDILSENIRSVQSLNQKDKDFILEYLNTLPHGDKLCHCDFHPENILILFNGSAKVIDWMGAGVGNPCADVCRTSLILTSNILPPNTPLIKCVVINIFRGNFYRHYINHYIKNTGMTLPEVEQWVLPISAAWLAAGIESEFTYLNGLISKKMNKVNILY
jgi:thiamine kinase-like enzyme